MKDRFNREIEYLRVSVTQNCNLKCIYCVPDKEVPGKGLKGPCCYACRSALNPVEFQTIVKVMSGLGIKKVRITGGEPLTRYDICEIVRLISEVNGIEDISMTTNGINLDGYAEKLKEAGLKRVNISLDSLNAQKFKEITGVGVLDKVLKGIEKALVAGLEPVKINTVLIKGINDMEIDDFFMLTKDMPVEVRFIELMPVGQYGMVNREKVVYNSDIIASHPELVYDHDNNYSQPARYFHIEGHRGRIGFISPISHKFCNCCNRIRLTCDGKIKTCLGKNSETDVIEVLRNKPDELASFIERLIFEKPEGHNFEKGFTSFRSMNEIGG
jgi:cyclic pyranopterin phosphate synthase